MNYSSLKQQLGCWAHERWRTELALNVQGFSWLDLHNRHESITVADDGRSRVCNWRDTSVLTVCRLFPETGARLLNHCLTQWPIAFSVDSEAVSAELDVSIIIAFRGTERLPQLQACLATLKAQQGVTCEIILVEQSRERLLDDESVPGVRHIHARSVSTDMPFNKSWAMNVGARHARADTLIFHDGDMLAPVGYAASICELVARGYQAARIPRLVFYPDRETSEAVQAKHSLAGIGQLTEVRQNCRGISLMIDRDAYWRIGGHDESFYGWGGEDDEILQRAQTLDFYPGGFMPFVHLWHPAQKEKHSGMIEREMFTARKLGLPVAERIAELRSQATGVMAGPCSSMEL
ncbi:glycosyltransferase family 2 protein [Mariprofundus ferrooxydans]|uniref:glycosyltransferase family 2 protein n=1 Tax=Mariprofundus ferrooxydans TaxID=314344 RepID=UPI00142F655C|nr:galactosyltransferase-related protein [Mariprofundus ferrooxydans]